MKKPKYFKIKWNGWDFVASAIENEKELGLWLKDGSLEEGDELFQISKKFTVVKWKDGRLLISEEEVA